MNKRVFLVGVGGGVFGQRGGVDSAACLPAQNRLAQLDARAERQFSGGARLGRRDGPLAVDVLALVEPARGGRKPNGASVARIKKLDRLKSRCGDCFLSSRRLLSLRDVAKHSSFIIHHSSFIIFFSASISSSITCSSRARRSSVTAGFS